MNIFSLNFEPSGPYHQICVQCSCGLLLDHRTPTGVVIDRDMRLFFKGCPRCNGDPNYESKNLTHRVRDERENL